LVRLERSTVAGRRAARARPAPQHDDLHQLESNQRAPPIRRAASQPSPLGSPAATGDRPTHPSTDRPRTPRPPCAGRARLASSGRGEPCVVSPQTSGPSRPRTRACAESGCDTTSAGTAARSPRQPRGSGCCFGWRAAPDRKSYGRLITPPAPPDASWLGSVEAWRVWPMVVLTGSSDLTDPRVAVGSVTLCCRRSSTHAATSS
jgi:hypothetical protein